MAVPLPATAEMLAAAPQNACAVTTSESATLLLDVATITQSPMSDSAAAACRAAAGLGTCAVVTVTLARSDACVRNNERSLRRRG